MKIAVFGTGYVGLSNAVLLAEGAIKKDIPQLIVNLKEAEAIKLLAQRHKTASCKLRKCT